MSRSTVTASLLGWIALGACAPSDNPMPTSDGPSEPSYVVLDEQLTRARTDFNAAADKLRLVFIVGPSCGICLRGMDDLQQSIVASVQNDPRIHTFVLHVPALDAEERHAAAAIPLMSGPRVSHFWDPSGQSGREFQEALGISFYAWDVWMIYAPGARWAPDQPPPAPDYWEHQLGPLPRATRLDPSRFADAVTTRVAALPPLDRTGLSAKAPQQSSEIMPVAQPRGYVIQQNHLSRGGYDALKRISSVRYEGQTDVDGSTYSLTVETSRPHFYRRTLSSGPDTGTVAWNGETLVRHGSLAGLPDRVQEQILASYDFDGWMTDYKDKGHAVWRLGMKKRGNRLPWLMMAELRSGQTWHLYVDSHSGDAFRQALIGADGRESLALEFDDYRDVDGFRVPHEVRYYDDDRLLATDRFHRVLIETKASNTASARESADDAA